MRAFLFGFVLFFANACLLEMKPHLNPTEEAEKRVIKLQAKGVDTIVTYQSIENFSYIGGVRIRSTPPMTLCWVNGKRGGLERYTTYHRSQMKKRLLSLKYLRSQADSIEHTFPRFEKLKESIRGDRSAQYDLLISICLGERRITYSLPDTIDKHPRYVFVRQLLEELTPIDQTKWKVRNVKRVRRKN